ncbi:MAG: Slp family lipoprotein [Aliivibrio sp.]|uniref:Slp family lipoprotein n=1 Tax=Aliivibrio sp. TaxID=1872443 RepID=UPI001A413E7A|nr:Slp family lipoprotein [Aliivibrio sp.]
MNHRLFIVLFSLFLSACSTLPEALQSHTPKPMMTLQQLVDDQGSGSDVRLGGVIAKVDNLQEKTRIEVVNMPISSVGKPNINMEPKGRFVVYLDGFVDPVTYSEGRLMTVVGKSAPDEEGKVGEFTQRFPVMLGYGHQLWKIVERVIINDVGSYHSPCYGLYCRGSRYHGSRQTGKITQEVTAQ